MKRNIEIYISEERMITVQFSENKGKIKLHNITEKGDVTIKPKDLNENQINFILSEINNILAIENN